MVQREVLLNAVMHRDYSTPSGYVAVAVFDDRIEVRSIGALPRGVTAGDLSGPHKSIPRDPLIAEAFHRTGAVEIWGRGTNRVIDACERHGIERPIFEEQDGAVYVTFRAQIGPTPQVTPQVTPEVTPQVVEVSRFAATAPGTCAERQNAAELKDREHFRTTHLDPFSRPASWR